MRSEAMSPRPNIKRTHARLLLVGLFALFFLPVLSAMLIAVKAPHWTPFGSINYGELVQPPVADALSEMIPLDAGPAYKAGSSAPWVIAHVGYSSCDSRCENTLAQMRQARLALGKDAQRVERWWLLAARPHESAVQAQMTAYPGLRIGLIDPRSPLLGGESSEVLVQSIDPAGFLVLRYLAANQEKGQNNDLGRALLKDFKRLLKISKQG